MMNLIFLFAAAMSASGGAELGSSCPALCRCEGADVDCVDVGLSDVPLKLSSSTSSLRLAGNSLTEIHKDAFAGLSTLKVLTLQNNHLTRVPSEALENLKNLMSLRLDANFIACLPPASFKNLKSLRHLWLDDNILTEVPVVALTALVKLQALTLALNNISFVPDSAFASLTQLVVLHLHHNQIRSLGQMCFNGLHNLETLDLSFNRLNSFPAAVTALINLKEINLQNNKIPCVPEKAFSGNPSMETINIRNNPLLTVGPSAFERLLQLQTLDLSFGSMDTLQNLQHLTLSGNLQLRVSLWQHHNIRAAELTNGVQCSVLPPCMESINPDTLDTISQSCQTLHVNISFIFILSIVFNSLVLLSVFFSSSEAEPPDSHRFITALFVLRFTIAISVVTLEHFGEFRPTGCGLLSFLFTLSSQASVLLMTGVVFKVQMNTYRRLWSFCFGFILTITALPLFIMEEKTLCSPCFLLRLSTCLVYVTALVTLNMFCCLFSTVTHIYNHRRQSKPMLNSRGFHDDATRVLLTFLLLTNTVLLSCASFICVSSLLFLPDVDACTSAGLVFITALHTGLDPLLYLILRPCFREKYQMSCKLKSESSEKLSCDLSQSVVSVSL